jgi:DNA-binding MarR family transcriptional regulator
MGKWENSHNSPAQYYDSLAIISIVDEVREQVPWPAECFSLAEDLGPLLGRLTLVLRREASHLPASAAQAAVLAILRDGPRRISDLTGYAGVAQPTMTVLIDRMERQAWVRRVPDPGDRRAVRVEITQLGEETISELLAVRTASLAQRLASLQPEHRRAIANALPALTSLVE